MSSPALVIYTLEHCPNCDLLKSYLRERGVSYREEDMSSVDSLTELRFNGVFAREAPVLRRDLTFLTSKQLFKDGAVVPGIVEGLIHGV